MCNPEKGVKSLRLQKQLLQCLQLNSAVFEVRVKHVEGAQKKLVQVK